MWINQKLSKLSVKGETVQEWGDAKMYEQMVIDVHIYIYRFTDVWSTLSFLHYLFPIMMVYENVPMGIR